MTMAEFSQLEGARQCLHLSSSSSSASPDIDLDLLQELFVLDFSPFSSAAAAAANPVDTEQLNEREELPDSSDSVYGRLVYAQISSKSSSSSATRQIDDITDNQLHRCCLYFSLADCEARGHSRPFCICLSVSAASSERLLMDLAERFMVDIVGSQFVRGQLLPANLALFHSELQMQDSSVAVLDVPLRDWQAICHDCPDIDLQESLRMLFDEFNCDIEACTATASPSISDSNVLLHHVSADCGGMVAEMFGKFSFHVHVLYALLSGVTVAVVSSENGENMVRKLVRLLTVLVPFYGQRRDCNVLSWVVDVAGDECIGGNLKSLKVLGMLKTRENMAVLTQAHNVQIGILDCDAEVYVGPSYSLGDGRLLRLLVECLQTGLADDELFLVHYKSVLAEIQSLVAVYRQLFGNGTATMAGKVKPSVMVKNRRGSLISSLGDWKSTVLGGNHSKGATVSSMPLTRPSIGRDAVVTDLLSMSGRGRGLSKSSFELASGTVDYSSNDISRKYSSSSSTKSGGAHRSHGKKSSIWTLGRGFSLSRTDADSDEHREFINTFRLSHEDMQIILYFHQATAPSSTITNPPRRNTFTAD